MIERAPRVFDVGFVTIKLSGKWMAKSLHKMLRDGVKETSISMLKYCKIDVEFSKPCEIALPKEENDKFRMEEKDGDVLIFRNPGGEQEPLIHAKRDGWSGINPMDDLADLWYGLKEEKADWIVCVTPVQQQEYLKMCIKAAQHAGWLPLHIRDSPRPSYTVLHSKTYAINVQHTGFQILNTKLKHENLSSLLDKAKSSCEAAAVELGYTGEQVSNCALKYTILKNNRLADYTFNSQEMLDAEGNAFVYLLNTQFRIRSFTKGSSEAIDNSYNSSKDSGGEVFAEIVAYYGSDFFKNVDHFEKKFYSATLLRNRFDPNIPEIPLERSMMAVPLGGSIVIKVILWDVFHVMHTHLIVNVDMCHKMHVTF
ncbi:arginine--tRNA ligase, chloroplastic/mitochondrial [Tanacetum coccineum]